MVRKVTSGALCCPMQFYYVIICYKTLNTVL